MITVTAAPVLDPQLVVNLLNEHEGRYPFEAVMRTLQDQKGLDESTSRELIWQVLALGFIEFTPDRATLRIRHNAPFQERVA